MAQSKKDLTLQREQHQELMRTAIESEGGIEKLERLMEMQKAWEDEQARKEFFEALSKFQEEMPVIEKKGLARFAHNQGGGETSYTFAKIDDIAKAIKTPLSNNHLSYRFEQTSEQSGSGPYITVTCIVSHRDGHTERAEMSGYPDQSGKKNPIQQIASTVSYLRRYTLTGALGIVTAEEDDDGQSAGNVGQIEEVDTDSYPQAQFDADFPGWEKLIKDGKKTKDQLIAFISSKGFVLTTAQEQKIQNIKA